jgi:hypothetical protein
MAGFSGCVAINEDVTGTIRVCVPKTLNPTIVVMKSAKDGA